MFFTPIRLSIIFIIAIIWTNCATYQKANTPNQIIKHSCELKTKINDTVSVEGIYSTCMEYSSFDTIKKDKCDKNSQTELNLDNPNLNPDLEKSIHEMYVCNATIKLIIRGILKKEGNGYGHLGTNDCELVVFEIIDHDEIKYE